MSNLVEYEVAVGLFYGETAMVVSIKRFTT